MRIFITNDDGIESNGIKAIIGLMKKYGDVFIVAPDKPMSGVGHAITMREPIQIDEYTKYEGVTAFSCSGTPVDCVKFGMGHLFENNPPDLLISGINHGSNASVNMLYSGTVAAAVEGCLYGIPSVAISSLSHDENTDLNLCIRVAEMVLNELQNHPPKPYILLNVNIPDILETDFRGIKYCRQALAYWREEFKEEVNNNGRTSFWLQGEFFCDDEKKDTDIWALNNNYASIVPVSLDLTAYSYLNNLKEK